MVANKQPPWILNKGILLKVDVFVRAPLLCSPLRFLNPSRLNARVHVVYADPGSNQSARVCGCVYVVPGVTILLSQTVFSLLVAHVLTRTSEAVPLIGTIFHHFASLYPI